MLAEVAHPCKRAAKMPLYAPWRPLQALLRIPLALPGSAVASPFGHPVSPKGHVWPVVGLPVWFRPSAARASVADLLGGRSAFHWNVNGACTFWVREGKEWC
jgi:hypothetical protein